MNQTALPALGSEFQGGTYAGITTGKDGKPYALILLADKPGGDLVWKLALAWAATLDADLPNRVECALLFQNLRAQLLPEWHWTNEERENDASYAWHCLFSYGDQIDSHKSAEGAAVAVRRLVLESFNPFEGQVERCELRIRDTHAAVTALLALCEQQVAAISELSAAS